MKLTAKTVSGLNLPAGKTDAIHFDQVRLPEAAQALRREVRQFLADEIAAGTFDPRRGAGFWGRARPGSSGEARVPHPDPPRRSARTHRSCA